jgi:hypothetical protein
MNFLGIDAGGTAVRWAVCGRDGALVARGDVLHHWLLHATPARQRAIGGKHKPKLARRGENLCLHVRRVPQQARALLLSGRLGAARAECCPEGRVEVPDCVAELKGVLREVEELDGHGAGPLLHRELAVAVV